MEKNIKDILDYIDMLSKFSDDLSEENAKKLLIVLFKIKQAALDIEKLNPKEENTTESTMQEEFDKQHQKKSESSEETVNHPSHYQSYSKDGVECIDAMIAAFGRPAVAHFCLCNAFKYQWRHSSKGGMEDIAKAQWYLNKYKELNIIDLGE